MRSVESLLRLLSGYALVTFAQQVYVIVEFKMIDLDFGLLLAQF